MVYSLASIITGNIKVMRLINFLSLWLLVCILSQCTPVETSGQAVEIQKTPSSSPYTLPTAAYIAMAQNQQGTERQSLLLMAAGQSIVQGEWNKARHIISQTGELNPEQSQEKALLTAQIALHNGQAKSALATVAKIPSPRQLSQWQQTQYYQVLAESYQQQKQYINSVRERIKLQTLLQDKVQQNKNLKALWVGLMAMTIADLHAQAVEVKPGSELRGWLELALLARQNKQSSDKTLQALQQWREEFPNHAGNLVLPESLAGLAEQ